MTTAKLFREAFDAGFAGKNLPDHLQLQLALYDLGADEIQSVEAGHKAGCLKRLSRDILAESVRQVRLTDTISQAVIDRSRKQALIEECDPHVVGMEERAG